MRLITDILKNNSAKKNFLCGLAMIVKADGVVSEEEIQLFTSLSQQLQLTPEETAEVTEAFKPGTAPDIDFATKTEQLYFLREATQMCFADGAYSEEERAQIEAFAKRFGISAETLGKMEQWSREGLEWQEAGDALLNLKG